MEKYIIIVAGGKGERMESQVPKQFIHLHHQPVIIHTINRFIQYAPSIHIIVVLPSELHSEWEQICRQHHFNRPHTIVHGGKTRFHSVKNGLQAIKNESIIGIHDAVRPFVALETIKRCFDVAAQKGNAVPAVQLAESVRKIVETGNIALDRTMIRMIQTPQVFRSELIIDAYSQPYQPEFTDDASVLEKAGHAINLVEGNPENIKITTPNDLELADFLLKNKQMKRP